MPVWLDSCERLQGQKSGGSHIAGVAAKFCFHTTQGQAPTAAEVRQRAREHPSPPHFWCSYEHQVAIQLIDLERSAYALKHDPTTSPQTNRAGVIQLEIDGFAEEAHTWSQAKLDWITDVIVAPACRAMGVDGHAFRRCLGEHDGVALTKTSSPIRMNDPDEWYAFNGLFGHQHAPGVSGNVHWDPGRLDLAYVSKRIVG